MRTRVNDEYARVSQDPGSLCHGIAKASGVDISLFFTFVSCTLLFCPVYLFCGFHIFLENCYVKDTNRRENTWAKRRRGLPLFSLTLSGDLFTVAFLIHHTAQAKRT